MGEDLLQIGVITSTHGLNGEVKVFPTTDDNNRFKQLRDCFIEYKSEMIPVQAKSCKFFKNMVILQFEGINNIDDIEPYKQCGIYVDRKHAVSLDEDEYFITDLIGMQVFSEDGNALGILREVMPTGANDVYVVVDENGGELLLPAIKECVLSVDMERKMIRIHLMKGLV